MCLTWYPFTLGAILISVCAIASSAFAVQTVYSNEATYLADLSAMGYVTASDDFEDNNFWGLLETGSVPDVTSQAVTWTGLGGGVTLDHQDELNGEWALESSPPGSPFDGFLATAEQPLFGFGGWFKAGNAGSGGQNDISAFLNGSPASFDGFGAPTSNYVFWGVIDTAGINSLQFETEPVELPEPGSGDQIDPSKTFFLDDFSFGFATAPSLREPGTAWNNAAGGTYTTGGNWNGGVAPLGTDNALFHLGSATPYTVTLSQNETASQAVVANDKVAMDLGGFQYDLTETNITRESLIVGERPGDVGELTVTGGTITGANIVVAHSTTSTGHLTLGTGSTTTLSGTMRVGSGGNGTLDINSGGVVTSGSSGVTYGGIIGQLEGTGIVNVDGAGSRWDIQSFKTLAVGLGGTGELNITGGAAVSARLVVAGAKAGNGLPNEPTGMGTINVSGVGTMLSNGNIMLGLDGTASMNVSDGAQVTGTGGTIATSADADVVVDGSGTSWSMNIGGSSRATLTVGAGDQIGNFATFPPPPLLTGTLTIQNGASVVNEEAFVGRTRKGKGILTVTGVGSSWASGSQFSGNTFIGYEGDGELNVINGATIQTGQTFVGRFGLRDRLRGVVNVDGAGSTWNSSGVAYVGFNNNNVTQPYNAGTVFFSEGIVNITDGASASLGGLTVGDRRLSKGTVNIDGIGSTVSVGSVQIGHIEIFTGGFATSFEGIGFVNVSNGGQLDVTGDIHIDAGVFDLQNGSVTANTIFVEGEQLDDGVIVVLSGEGTIDANVVNSGGFLSPGHSAGVLNINGDLTQLVGASLQIELGGLLQGTEYDHIDVSGTATLGGTLDVSLLGGFSPVLGDSFGFLSATGGFGGTFDTLNLPALTGGLQWQLNPGGSTLFLNVIGPPLAGDFNLDGTVDAADYTVWRDGLGTTYTQADYTVWVNNFGNSQSASTSVPEPTALLLAGWAIFLVGHRRTRSKG